FRAIVPARAITVTMFVNGEPAADMELVEIDSLTFEITGRSPRLLEVGGLYVVTVVYTVDEDGIIHAEALPFAILEDSQ
ncbi:MAG: hypothetical protein KJO18_08690, partial [Acidimicrobiia bacterium]|nr:hypothetical protein [Acidimicrobiia bacterium]